MNAPLTGITAYKYPIGTFNDADICVHAILVEVNPPEISTKAENKIMLISTNSCAAIRNFIGILS